MYYQLKVIQLISVCQRSTIVENDCSTILYLTFRYILPNLADSSRLFVSSLIIFLREFPSISKNFAHDPCVRVEFKSHIFPC